MKEIMFDVTTIAIAEKSLQLLVEKAGDANTLGDVTVTTEHRSVDLFRKRIEVDILPRVNPLQVKYSRYLCGWRDTSLLHEMFRDLPSTGLGCSMPPPLKRSSQRSH